MRPTGLLPAFEAMNAPDEDGDPAKPILSIGGMPGWITNGWAAAFVGEEIASAFKQRDGARAIPLLAATRIPAAENVSLRIPFVPSNGLVRPKCATCKGMGVAECNLGHEHDCTECDGDGRTGPHRTDEKIGQRVYRAAGVDFLLQDRVGALLDGLTVAALGGAEDPLAGIDADGDIVVMAMGMRGTPDKPVTA